MDMTPPAFTSVMFDALSISFMIRFHCCKPGAVPPSRLNATVTAPMANDPAAEKTPPATGPLNVPLLMPVPVTVPVTVLPLIVPLSVPAYAVPSSVPAITAVNPFVLADPRIAPVTLCPVFPKYAPPRTGPGPQFIGCVYSAN